MIRLTTEQAQQIEEALEDIVRVFTFETGTPVEALATIRAARAQELNLNCKSVQKRLATQWGYVKADQAEQEPVGRWNWNEAKFEWLTKFDYYKHHMTPLYAAPQPDYKALWEQMCKRCDELDLELAKYTEPTQQAEQEPVMEILGGDNGHRYAALCKLGELPPVGTKLYAAPVRTKDLTDYEIVRLYAESPMCDSEMIEFARAVIAADREKNK